MGIRPVAPYIESTPNGAGLVKGTTVGEVIDLMETARTAVMNEHAAHRDACGFRNFTGLHHNPETVRYVLNNALPNELHGQGVGDIPDRLIAYVLRRVSLDRATYRAAESMAAEHDAAVALSLDLEQEITRRLTHR